MFDFRNSSYPLGQIWKRYAAKQRSRKQNAVESRYLGVAHIENSPQAYNVGMSPALSGVASKSYHTTSTRRTVAIVSALNQKETHCFLTKSACYYLNLTPERDRRIPNIMCVWEKSLYFDYSTIDFLRALDPCVLCSYAIPAHSIEAERGPIGLI